MAQTHEYTCTGCGAETSRDLLTVKKVVFAEMGAGSRTIRSRVAGWYCPPCVKADPDWRIEPHRPRRLSERREVRG